MTDEKTDRTPISDDILDRVRRMTDAGERPTAAIRQVAADLGRSAGSTSSAYYAALRRERKGDAGPSVRHQRQSDRLDSVSLYREMLPLVEAGASAQQAARRFGGDDIDAQSVAAGFARWHERESVTVEPAEVARAAADIGVALDDAGARIESLEAENRALRREVVRARQALTRVRAIVDGAIAGEVSDRP